MQNDTIRGFTLIEMILYVATSAFILLALGAFIFTTLQARVKNEVITEVEQQGQYVMRIMSQIGRNSENITSPSAGSSAASLTLDVFTAANDPTVFDESGGVIRITEGVESPVNLTSSRVIASSLTFQNATRGDSPGSIQVTFTLTHVDNNGRFEYDYSQIFHTTVSLRQ
jgi:Tfp pilus assembly protein PilW